MCHNARQLEGSSTVGMRRVESANSTHTPNCRQATLSYLQWCIVRSRPMQLAQRQLVGTQSSQGPLACSHHVGGQHSPGVRSKLCGYVDVPFDTLIPRVLLYELPQKDLAPSVQLTSAFMTQWTS